MKVLSLLMLAGAVSTPSASLPKKGFPPPGGAPIYAHPTRHFVVLFDQLCVANDGQAALQELAAREKKFVPGKNPRWQVDLTRRSVSFVIRQTAEEMRCIVSGLANEEVTLDRLASMIAVNLNVGPHQAGTIGKGAFAQNIAVWRPLHSSGESWAYASASPQRIVDRADLGATHIVLTLVTPSNGVQ